VYETILFERDGGVATIALNRPEVLNAFNGQMHGELHHALDGTAEDEEVRCVVLRGEGRGFSAGADLKSEDLSRGTGSLQTSENICARLTARLSRRSPRWRSP
jgi:2-(1,2-epoxy-1,2-dihydrophenyl)acetyl-CoA isomerase